MKELERKLKKLSQHDLENAMSYYVEYFEDAAISDDVDVTIELGTPSKIASEILADYAVSQPQNEKSFFKSIGFITLAILAAPIGLPLALACIILLFVPVIIIAALAFAFSVTTIAFIGSGVYSIGVSFLVLTQSVQSTILMSGVGCLMIGLGLLMGLVVLFLTKKSTQLLVKGFRYTLNRLTHRYE